MKKFRFALAQMNAVVGDFSGNTRKIIHWIRRAEKKKADMIVFPEAALAGYPVWDLANKKRFVEEGLRHLERVIRATKGMRVGVALGFIDKPREKRKRSYNALAWIQNGRLAAKQYKRLLPTYDVFLEDLFFQPGKSSKVIAWRGHKIAPLICEDIWDFDYDACPLMDLKKQGADLAVNLSASPYYRGVGAARENLLKKHAARYRFPMIYTNMVGCQDDLIFDGRSLFVDREGRVLFRGPAFEEGLFFFDWDPGQKNPEVLPAEENAASPEEVYRALVLGIRDYCRKNGFKKAVLGLSGGIDSALVACLAADALGPRAVCAVTMPSRYSSAGSWRDSGALAENLGIECRKAPIRNQYRVMLREIRAMRPKGKQGRTALVTPAMENLQARIRGLELMYVSNAEGRLLLSTGNKSEMAMGYCTLYGDMAGGLSVIADVYKTDVYRLALYRNRSREVIPGAILNKAPSAELRPNQKDEDSLPPYPVLDEVLYLYIEKNLSRDEITARLKPKGIGTKIIGEIIHKVDHNEYKRRQTAPVLRVSEKCWFGRRMPITNRFQH